ncbi:hypothetical protein [Burkholderia cenocepacia]|uniref:hypothetical protein n=1 Tax=Burkholderia cenocepacia TaxID=95486 RepID=UPI0011B8184D|nr:hypothetical protein [Burkholderia cenocepacia]
MSFLTVGANKITTLYRWKAFAPGTTSDRLKETAMPVVNAESSLDRTRLEFDHHVGRWINQDCNFEFADPVGGAK